MEASLLFDLILFLSLAVNAVFLLKNTKLLKELLKFTMLCMALPRMCESFFAQSDCRPPLDCTSVMRC